MKRVLTAAVLVLGVAGCDGAGFSSFSRGTSVSPASRAAPTAPSATSVALARYYESTQSRMLAQGLLRQDRGGADAQFSAGDLAENFERIALFNEYTVRQGRFVAQQTPSRLRRWSNPVVIQTVFGPSVTEEQSQKDVASVARYAQRLSRVSGHPIRVTDGENANFHVLFLNSDELSSAGPLLQQLLPAINGASITGITQMPRSTFCAVYAFSDRTNPNSHVAAIAVIKAEHPDLLRLSCIHEEIAQGLGLANDSPAARPSIFNDDDEFALLTQHDELLLSMLYDPRLRPGMTPEQARPTVSRIAREKLSGAS